jgi:hypothetical protein
MAAERLGIGTAPVPIAVEVVRKRHWWSDGHTPYRNNIHDPETDRHIGSHALIDRLLGDADDGELVEITVRRVGQHDTEGRWERTKPHHYERVTNA